MSFFAREIAKQGHVLRMEHAGFKAELKKAKRLVDNGSPHNLPDGESIPVYPIAALPGSPDSWSREAGTYVCPVSSNWGLWFDWTMNDDLNTAVLPSVKGMNPISGLKLDGLTLSEFSDRCPIHDEPLSHANFCTKCGYEWPAQNYVSYPNTLWWDGFRQPDGKVRQFFFSEDDNRDVASHVIGKENTVPAFGFGFFKTKSPRIVKNYESCRLTINQINKWGVKVNTLNPVWLSDDDNVTYTSSFFNHSNEPDHLDSESIIGPSGNVGLSRGIMRSVKSVSVGAGAEIYQSVVRDSLGVSGWNQEPSAIIRLYFCFEEQFKSIVSRGGVLDFKKNNLGFLSGVPVG
jgi:hypothetical protein